jgi:hypothetical protein
MSAYTDGIAAKISRVLETDSEALISIKAISKESAASMAKRLSCNCALRHADTCFEFSRNVLAAEHESDLVLIGESWEAFK